MRVTSIITALDWDALAQQWIAGARKRIEEHRAIYAQLQADPHPVIAASESPLGTQVLRVRGMAPPADSAIQRACVARKGA